MRGTVFGARWEFTCACCGTVQPPDSLAVYRPDGLLVSAEPDHTPGDGDYYASDASDASGREHPGRVPEVMPRGKTKADRCDNCFMIHSTGQAECY